MDGRLIIDDPEILDLANQLARLNDASPTSILRDALRVRLLAEQGKEERLRRLIAMIDGVWNRYGDQDPPPASFDQDDLYDEAGAPV